MTLVAVCETVLVLQSGCGLLFGIKHGDPPPPPLSWWSPPRVRCAHSRPALPPSLRSTHCAAAAAGGAAVPLTPLLIDQLQAR